MSYKQDIIRLRKKGKSYDQIEDELGCSRSTISYHCKNEDLQDIGLENQRKEVSSKTKEKIKSLRKSHTVDEVSDLLDVSESTVVKYSDSKPKEAELNRKPKKSAKDFVGTKQHKGILTESKVKTRFIELGYTVLEPQIDRRYDIAVEDEGNFNRIQIKSSKYENGKIQISFRWGNGKQGKYRYESVDYFATWNSKTDKTYIVPNKDRRSISLRVENPKTNQVKNINYAKKYRLDETVSL